MNSLTRWWFNNQLDSYSLEMLNKPNDSSPEQQDEFHWDETACYFRQGKIPLASTLANYTFKVYNNASKLISWVFFENIDEDTLIVTSNVEHEVVEKTLKGINRYQKDHVILDWDNDVQTLNISKIIQACQTKKYKKAFVYIIGTQISTGEIAPQAIYEKIKEYFDREHVECKIAIDDVHGMFLIPRDYSIFDYVFCTAHALIRRFDMGMLWSKGPFPYGFTAGNWIEDYSSKLKRILAMEEFLRNFSFVMQEEFKPFIKDNVSYKANSAPHIFSLQVNIPPKYIFTRDDWEACSELEVRLEHKDLQDDDMFYIRMRAAQYITFPELLEPAIEKVKEILQRIDTLKGE